MNGSDWIFAGVLLILAGILVILAGELVIAILRRRQDSGRTEAQTASQAAIQTDTEPTMEKR